MKFLKTYRFDASDAFAFERAAEPGEWAVPGAFMFAGRDPDALRPKERLAMRQGFLGLTSFGWSTFVMLASIDEAVFERLVEDLAGFGVEHLSAPSLTTARKAARHELDFAASLCDHPIGTILCVEREPGAMGWREAFRTIRPAQGLHAPVFTIEADDEETKGEGG